MSSRSCEYGIKRYPQESKYEDQQLYLALRQIFKQLDRIETTPEEVILTEPNSLIKLILKQEPSLSKAFQNRTSSILWVAVLSGYMNSAELLVQNGADVNELSGCSFGEVPIDEKATVLHVVLSYCYFDACSWSDEFVHAVIKKSANLNARDSKGYTALHFAAECGRVRVTEWLLENGAEVDLADNRGKTPLLWPAFTEKSISADELLTVTLVLLNWGADVTARGIDGMNALHILAFADSSCERLNQADVLIKWGVPVNERDHREYYQPIHYAAKRGNEKLTKLLLEYGADANAQTEDGEFPLFLAAHNPAVLRTLIQGGARIDLRTKHGETALHRACLLHDVESVDLLLRVGADILAEDRNGKTPFALIQYKDVSNQKTSLMLKELALKKVCLQPLIELKDERIIGGYPQLWDFYQQCIQHLNKMKFTKIFESCTFFDLLTKSHCQFNPLISNSKFKKNFKKHDLDEFSMYSKDLLRAFEIAKCCYRSKRKQKDMINQVFYQMLPQTVVRKVARYLQCPVQEKYIFNYIVKTQY